LCTGSAIVIGPPDADVDPAGPPHPDSVAASKIAATAGNARGQAITRCGFRVVDEDKVYMGSPGLVTR
jgi:hypothetical protein